MNAYSTTQRDNPQAVMPLELPVAFSVLKCDSVKYNLSILCEVQA